MVNSQILVVDNENEIVEYIKKGLSRRNFKVDIETNPKKVAQRIKHTVYNVIILDIHMPVYGGAQVLIDIMSFSGKSKVILMSGQAKGEEILECIKRGAVDFISKPIDIDDLQARIHVVLNNPIFHEPEILREHLIESLWLNIKNETCDKRGTRLEQLLQYIFASVTFFQDIKTNIKTDSEEIDIGFINYGKETFWTNCGGIILAECKNWSDRMGPVERKEFDAFNSKVENRGNFCKMGFFISYSGFSEGFKMQQKILRRNGKLIVLIDRSDLERLVMARDREKLFMEYIRKATY
jgi:CheY-like chemotaxis protein